MNYYVFLKHFVDLPAVTLYTIRFEEISGLRHDLTEYEKFIERFENDHTVSDTYGIISESILIMGEVGADLDMFRLENRAVALPPPGRRLAILGHEYRDDFPPLRLYMMRVCDQILILFNGGLKTNRTAQLCPNVSTHFRTANSLCNQIDDRIRSREIVIDGNRLITDLSEPFII